MLDKVGLGDVIVFRYDSPKKINQRFTFNAPRNIMVLTPNFAGHLHGIKIDGLTPVEQESIQALLRASHQNPANFLEPLKAQLEMKKKELEALNKQRIELVKRGQGVILTPSSGFLSSMADKTKNILGAIIGKVKTFGRTQVQATPVIQANPVLDQKIKEYDMILNQKKMELDMFYYNVEMQQKNLMSMPRIPTNPYEFYHGFLKGFIHNNKRMKQIYRKFDVRLIKSPRILNRVSIK